MSNCLIWHNTCTFFYLSASLTVVNYMYDKIMVYITIVQISFFITYTGLIINKSNLRMNVLTPLNIY